MIKGYCLKNTVLFPEVAHPTGLNFCGIFLNVISRKLCIPTFKTSLGYFWLQDITKIVHKILVLNCIEVFRRGYEQDGGMWHIVTIE